MSNKQKSNQVSILRQAKSGNPKAIAFLLNNYFETKGISAVKVVKSELAGSDLALFLESDKVLNEIHRVFGHYGVECIFYYKSCRGERSFAPTIATL